MKKLVVVLVLSFTSGIGGAFFYNSILFPQEQKDRLNTHDGGLATPVNGHVVRTGMFSGETKNGDMNLRTAELMSWTLTTIIRISSL